MILSVEMPMSFAASRLNETARIALPVRVRRMKKRSASISSTDTTMTVSCSLVMRTCPRRTSARGASDGKNLGSGPKTSWDPFSMKSETPIAVMSSVRRDARRTGRYANRSITTPTSAHASIDPSITRTADTKDGSSPRRRRDR